MAEIIAGVEVPDDDVVVEATRLAREMTTPMVYHHSRRVYLFGVLRARALGSDVDPMLLYLAAMFHDAGLLKPFSDVEQRFELDGADHARRFLSDRGFDPADTDVVWSAIALHTTPGIPARMGSAIGALQLGVLTDAVGLGLEAIAPDAIVEITTAHPRGDFKQEFLRTFHEGLRHRPDTTYGTVNADVLDVFEPGFRRSSMVERILQSPWAD